MGIGGLFVGLSPKYGEICAPDVTVGVGRACMRGFQGEH